MNMDDDAIEHSSNRGSINMNSTTYLCRISWFLCVMHQNTLYLLQLLRDSPNLNRDPDDD